MSVQQLGWTSLNNMFFVNEFQGDVLDEAQALLGIERLPGEYTTSFKADTLTSEENRKAIQSLPKSRLKELILATCTVAHEHAHIQQISNTTYGVWNSLNQLNVLDTTFSALIRMRESGMTKLRIPLLEWQRLELPDESWSKELRKLGYWVEIAFMNQDLMSGRKVLAISDVILTQDRLRLLDPNYPVRYISERAGYDSSPARLTVSHLLEAQARQEEKLKLAYWRIAGVPEDLLQEIFSEMHVEGYIEAQDVFKREFVAFSELSFQQEVECYVIALHLALSPNLFGNTCHLNEPQVWEETQPCWRFVALLGELRNMNIPVSPLQEYATFTEDICRRLNWVTPLELVRNAVKSNAHTAGILGPLVDDIYDRYRFFGTILTRSGLPLSASYNGELFQRCIPWMRGDGESMVFQNVPPELGDTGAMVTCLSTLILEEALCLDSFSDSKRVHRMLNHENTRLRNWSPEKVEQEYESIASGVLSCDFTSVSACKSVHPFQVSQVCTEPDEAIVSLDVKPLDFVRTRAQAASMGISFFGTRRMFFEGSPEPASLLLELEQQNLSQVAQLLKTLDALGIHPKLSYRDVTISSTVHHDIPEVLKTLLSLAKTNDD
ncbi:hypothetical protein KJ815_13995 [bacterium]|nr:hypothetical protein [bacterium]